jgi:hypothetical protein
MFLAYIAGASALGLTPRATLEIPGSANRLERIKGLIAQCQFSIHDLSRIELDRSPPPTPRFNMPFELGLAVGMTERPSRSHTWFVFETKARRVQKSLSDLNGTDVYVHGGTPMGVFSQLLNAFARDESQPTVKEMTRVLTALEDTMEIILDRKGADNPFQARVFKELTVYANAVVSEIIGSGR